MTKADNEVNIVEVLRLKTEETDISQYLKSTLGGYTKTSVLEYLNLLRKQQQSMAETFSHNQQVLFEEKENLRKTNDSLKFRLSQVESEYRELSNSIKIHECSDNELSLSDVFALKTSISSLEDELNKRDVEKSGLEHKIAHQKITIDELLQKLEQSGREKTSIQEIVKAEVEKTKEQKLVISRLSGTIEEKNEEIKFLSALVSEGQFANLTAKVNELTEQLMSQAEVIATYNSESSLKSQTLETLMQENGALKQSLEDLTRTVENMGSQNGKYLAANHALSEQLEIEYKKSIVLIKEKSAETMEKLATARKLDEANSKILMLELKLKQQPVLDEAEAGCENSTQAKLLHEVF